MSIAFLEQPTVFSRQGATQCIQIPITVSIIVTHYTKTPAMRCGRRLNEITSIIQWCCNALKFGNYTCLAPKTHNPAENSN